MGQRQSQPAQPRKSTLRRMSDVVQNKFKKSRLGSFTGTELGDPSLIEQPMHQPPIEPIYTPSSIYPSELSEYHSLDSRQTSHELGEVGQEAPIDTELENSEAELEDDSSVHRDSASTDNDPHPIASLLGRLLAIAASMTAASLIGEGDSPFGFLEFVEELLTADLTSRTLLRTFSFPESNGQVPLVIVWVRERNPGDSWVILVIGSNFPSGHPITQVNGNMGSLEELLVAEGLMEQQITQESIDALGGLRLAQRDEDRCAICLQDCLEGDEVRALKCNHEYHKYCVDKWVLKGHNSCPICRQKVVQAPQPPEWAWDATTSSAASVLSDLDV